MPHAPDVVHAGAGRGADAAMVSLPPPLRPDSRWREVVLHLGAHYSTRARRRRAELFRHCLPVTPTARVLDLGGADGTYMAALGLDADIYIADVDGAQAEDGAHRYGFTAVTVPPTGRLPFPDGYFDVVFCSSVIEHVTVPAAEQRAVTSTSEFHRRAVAAQRQFADEVRRIGKRYFIQTPNRYFPIESHTWMPAVLVALPRRWQLAIVDWANGWWPKSSFVDFHLLSASELHQACPDATIVRERSFGLTKSLIALKCEQAGDGGAEGAHGTDGAWTRSNAGGVAAGNGLGWRVVRAPIVGNFARAVSHGIAAAPPWSPLRLLAPVRSRLKGEMTAGRLLAVVDALTQAGVPHWIAGGWGIDALHGRQSRRHDDLDVVVGDFDRWVPTARDVLMTLGFQLTERNTQPAALLGDQWALDDGAGGRVDLLRLESARLAEVLGLPPVGAGPDGCAALDALFANGRVGGRPVACLSADVQHALHSGFAARAVDRHDLRVLRR